MIWIHWYGSNIPWHKYRDYTLVWILNDRDLNLKFGETSRRNLKSWQGQGHQSWKVMLYGSKEPGPHGQGFCQSRRRIWGNLLEILFQSRICFAQIEDSGYILTQKTWVCLKTGYIHKMTTIQLGKMIIIHWIWGFSPEFFRHPRIHFDLLSQRLRRDRDVLAEAVKQDYTVWTLGGSSLEAVDWHMMYIYIYTYILWLYIHYNIHSISYILCIYI
jgi:hypothetical protein